MYSYQQIQQTLSTKGYIWYDTGNYNLNIVGVRNSNTNYQITNLFDDILCVCYKKDGIQQYKEYPITTEPGLYYSQNLLDANGVAIMVPGQYQGGWKLGLHQGKYEALVQRKPVKVYRDKDKDKVYDLDAQTIQEGFFGINIHKSGWDSQQINKWSAGCQVFKKESDFNEFISICKEAIKIWGNSYTYTLIESKDIK